MLRRRVQRGYLFRKKKKSRGGSTSRIVGAFTLPQLPFPLPLLPCHLLSSPPQASEGRRSKCGRLGALFMLLITFRASEGPKVAPLLSPRKSNRSVSAGRQASGAS